MSENYCTVAVGLIISLSLVNLFLSNVITDPNCRNVYNAPKVTKYLHLPYNVSRYPTFDYKKEMETLNKEQVKADDPRLVSLIRNYYIELPSDKPYVLKEPDRRDSSYGQAAFVDGTLGNMVSY